MTIVTMPQLGESVTEGTVVAWHKAVGDEVALDEPLCEIETEKVTAELPSPVAGRLARILVQQGETVAVGAPLCDIEEAAATAGSAGPGSAGAAARQRGEQGARAPVRRERPLRAAGRRQRGGASIRRRCSGWPSCTGSTSRPYGVRVSAAG
ncbi:MAG: hypothetical protein KatS3mg062_0972 [Tepidiforma sp.]|nr:MAG: hypothetical protein KatS3mg062_0972 [Tepidiforma sp.]